MFSNDLLFETAGFASVCYYNALDAEFRKVLYKIEVPPSAMTREFVGDYDYLLHLVPLRLCNKYPGSREIIVILAGASAPEFRVLVGFPRATSETGALVSRNTNHSGAVKTNGFRNHANLRGVA